MKNHNCNDLKKQKQTHFIMELNICTENYSYLNEIRENESLQKNENIIRILKWLHNFIGKLNRWTEHWE